MSPLISPYRMSSTLARGVVYMSIYDVLSLRIYVSHAFPIVCLRLLQSLDKIEECA